MTKLLHRLGRAGIGHLRVRSCRAGGYASHLHRGADAVKYAIFLVCQQRRPRLVGRFRRRVSRASRRQYLLIQRRRRLRAVVEYELIPLLKEYWFDEPEKVRCWSALLREAVR